ncbi:MAG: hypothetical protein J7J17_01805 [Hadesarchaea archaeon]|nr:hypothetical protein [Hadesarchaea archaeon]
MGEAIDIHGSTERLRRAERLLEETSLSARNVELIKEFEGKLISEGSASGG